MAIPFTVDISAFYGEPDFREQNSSTIVDRRKTLNLHKELESGKTNEVAGKSGGAAATLGAKSPVGFRSVKNSNFNSGGELGSKGAVLLRLTEQTIHEVVVQTVPPPAAPLLSMNNN